MIVFVAVFLDDPDSVQATSSRFGGNPLGYGVCFWPLRLLRIASADPTRWENSSPLALRTRATAVPCPFEPKRQRSSSSEEFSNLKASLCEGQPHDAPVSKESCPPSHEAATFGRVTTSGAASAE